MMNGMEGMGWTMILVGLFWLLVVIALVLGNRGAAEVLAVQVTSS